MAVVPFTAFGATDESGWCRLSVGAVSNADIDGLLPRLEAALRALQWSGDGASLTGGTR
jgi:aspartate aminotransferase